MSDDIDLLDYFADEALLLVKPVLDAIKTTETVQVRSADGRTLTDFEITQDMQVLELIRAAGLDPNNSIAKSSQQIQDIVAKAGDFDISNFSSVKDMGTAVFTAIGQLMAAVNASDPKAAIPDFLGYLIVRWLDDHHPVGYASLCLLGVINETAYRDQKAGQFRFDELGRALTTPYDGFKAGTGFGGDELAVEDTLEHVRTLLSAIGLLAFDIDAPPHDLGGLTPSDDDDAKLDPGISVSILDHSNLFVNAALLSLPKVGQESPGFLLTVFSEGFVKGTFDLGNGFEARLKGEAALESEVGVVLRPSGIKAEYSGALPLPELKATVEIGKASPELRDVALGPVSAEMPVWPEAHFGAVIKDKADVYAEVVLRDVKITIGTDGKADGFLKKILPSDGIGTRITPRLGLSLADGFYLDRGSGLRADLPTGLELGAILSVIGLGVAIKPAADAFDIDLGAAGRAALGPIKATVDGIGSTVKLDFRSGTQSNEPYKVSTDFKPPTGLGFEIKKGPVTGKGFILRDPDAGRYAGALSLKIKSVGLTALGVLDTKLPDGEEGFSLILFMSGRFKPIPIGFGFNLVGVGGIVGLHRDVDVDKLFAGVRSGMAGKLLNPKDPVKDANKLVKAASDIFPIKRGQFVLGPTVGLTWGTPKPLVTIDLALAVTFPEPLRIILIGTVSAKIPKVKQEKGKKKKPAPLSLNVDVAGVLDISASRFDMEGRIYDSVIQLIPIEGGFALRSSWGEPSGFAFSVGGFHPGFEAPAGFPELKPLGANLSKKKNFSVSLLGYLAVTSNSVQLGAKAELKASAAGFRVEAELGFDALLIIDPLSLDLKIYAGAVVKKGTSNIATLRLEGRLRGPGPWVIDGRVVLEIAFFDIDIDIHGEFGSESTALPEPVNLRQLIADDLLLPGAWRLAEGETGPLVLDDVDDKILPLAPVRVAQKIAPLATDIDVISGRRIDRAQRFTLGALSIGGVAFTKTDPVMEPFSPGQFQHMDDAEKLTSDDFASFEAGAFYEAAATAQTFDAPKQAPVGPEVIVIDETPPPERPAVSLVAHQLNRRVRPLKPDHRIKVAPENWVSVDDSMRPTSDPRRYTDLRKTGQRIVREGELA
ncbi:MAG: DUF6603 domain-containing protein [Pseudomonadota bacterium]